MKKVFNLAVIITFCAIIFLVPVMTVLRRSDGYSVFENRSLTPRPVFSVSGLFNGEYLPQWDKCYSDRIWNRDSFMKAYTYLNMMLLKKPVVNDVVVQKDVLLPFNEYSTDHYDTGLNERTDGMAGKLSRLNEEIEKYGGKFVYVGIPEQCSMLRDLYPDYLDNNGKTLSQTEEGFFAALENNCIGFINMREEFLDAEDYKRYYSMTDHHFNLFGAFYTYQKMIDKINADFGAGLPALSEDDIEFVPLANPFYGSRNRKLYNVYDSDENLYYYTQKEPLTFAREDNGSPSDAYVFLMPGNETSPATYLLYMGGDIGETVIKTNREELPNALIFGDSFTNPIETFVYQSFNETRSLDLRHYDKMTLMEYIAEFKPDYVFCVRDDTQYLSNDGNGNILE